MKTAKNNFESCLWAWNEFSSHIINILRFFLVCGEVIKRKMNRLILDDRDVLLNAILWLILAQNFCVVILCVFRSSSRNSFFDCTCASGRGVKNLTFLLCAKLFSEFCGFSTRFVMCVALCNFFGPLCCAESHEMLSTSKHTRDDWKFLLSIGCLTIFKAKYQNFSHMAIQQNSICRDNFSNFFSLKFILCNSVVHNLSPSRSSHYKFHAH